MEVAGLGPSWNVFAHSAPKQQGHPRQRSARMHLTPSLTRAPAQHPRRRPQHSDPLSLPQAHTGPASGRASLQSISSRVDWRTSSGARRGDARGALSRGKPASGNRDLASSAAGPQRVLQGGNRASILRAIGEPLLSAQESAWNAREEGNAAGSPAAMPPGVQAEGPGGRDRETQEQGSVGSRPASGAPVVHHFAFGSNLSSQKLLNRVPGGLRPLHWEPAVVYGHRLAFNLRGLNLVEPSWASIEPVEEGGAGAQGTGTLRVALEARPSLEDVWAPQVHGILVTLQPKDYEALYLSEGGSGGPFSAYIEHQVEAVTYSGETYEAVAFRTNPSSPSKLPRRQEQLPSRRYLTLIVEGARERGLHPHYVSRLEKQLARIRDPWALFL